MDTIEFISLREYAKKIGVSKETARAMCKDFYEGKPIKGEYTPVKVDTTWVLFKFLL